MSSDYSQLADVADVIDSSHQTPTYVECGVPMVRVTDVKYGVLSLSSARHVSVETFRDYSRRYKAKPRDIIISRVGSYGNTAWVAETEFCLGQNVASISPKMIDARYLFFALNSSLVWSQIESKVVGSTQKTLSLKAIRELRIPRFGDATESSIGKFLGALDDRITLLRETNATLESIAQALFKSWFVDFDPVRAKQEGRAPDGMDEATAALFPDGFEESELGLVPRGWRVGTLGDVLALRNERTKPSGETKALPYVPIESISAKVPFLQEYKSGEEANSSLILFRKGDILFGAMRPYFHKVCIAPFDGVTRTTVFTLKSTNPNASGFALFLAFQETTIEYATQHSEGSTIPYAKWGKSLEYMPIILPPESVKIAFSEIAFSFIERANESVEQAQTLATLRDTLLPRLISGQLRLPEAEAMPEEVTL